METRYKISLPIMDGEITFKEAKKKKRTDLASCRKDYSSKKLTHKSCLNTNA